MSGTKTFEKAEDFLQALLRFGRGPKDWYRAKGTYVFRGQADAEWPLRPKRFREYAGNTVPTIAQQAAREFHETRRFFDMADQHGLEIPGDTQHLRLTLNGPSVESHTWPDPDFWSLLAVGQHYGFPTRLLDWSRMPRVAAYFAAAEASARAKASSSSVESPLGSDIAVWVLDLQEFNDVRSDPHGEERWSEFPFWFITAPGHANRNLAAQQGCFTLYSPTVQVTETDRPLDIRPLDEVYARIEKLTLAVSEAPALLWLLDREGVTAASIFPGYAGVSQALRDEQLHEPIAALEETAH